MSVSLVLVADFSERDSRLHADVNARAKQHIAGKKIRQRDQFGGGEVFGFIVGTPQAL
jgi:hypothetical protein